MAIKLENVGPAVRDLDAAIAFFTDLGLTVIGRDDVSGEWADTAVGLDGDHARIAFSVDDLDAALKIAARHGCLPLRGVATY